MDLDIKLTKSTEDILTRYDAEKLLTQGMNIDEYFEKNKTILPKIISIYSSKVRFDSSFSSISLSDDTYTTLIAVADNCNISFEVLFNYLITNVCNCGKINSIRVDKALDFYYNAVNSKDKSLFLEILEKYGDSVYYNEEHGLNEEDVVYFLLNTKEGKDLINKNK